MQNLRIILIFRIFTKMNTYVKLLITQIKEGGRKQHTVNFHFTSQRREVKRFSAKLADEFVF